MKLLCKLSAVILAGFLFVSSSFADSQFIELQTRPNVTQGVYIVKPSKPVATVILLPGGTGKVRLGPDGPKKEGNFLVRTRDLFAENGLMAIVVDAPSDLIDAKKGLKGNRTSADHLTDIKAIIDYARKQETIPVWLVGTSRGTISATYIAAQAPIAVNGIVLTSTVSLPTKKGGASVMDVGLEKITVPVLLAHHEKDNCYVSPSNGLDDVRKRLSNAKLVGIMSFKGGKEKSGKECKGQSHHGFFKIEERVVKDISNWIKSH